MAKRPNKKPNHSWSIYRLRGTPAQFIGIVYDRPDQEAASSKRSRNLRCRPISVTGWTARRKPSRRLAGNAETQAWGLEGIGYSSKDRFRNRSGSVPLSTELGPEGGHRFDISIKGVSAKHKNWACAKIRHPMAGEDARYFFRAPLPFVGAF
jgi:hypothetical protein